MIAAFPELAFSLTVQATFVLLVAWWLTHQQSDCRDADHLWSAAHLLILIQCLIGVFLPHVRLLPQSVWPAEVAQITPESAVAFAKVLLVIWSTGAVLLTIAIILSFVQSAILLSNSRSLHRSTAEKQSLIIRNGIVVDILVNPLLTTPFCWQFHRPLVVIPETVADFPDDELQAILRHEMAHLSAKHPFSLFLQRIVELLFWFHPLVWVTSRNAALTRELVSDKNAVRCRDDAASLLKGLHRLSEIRLGRIPELPAGLAFVASGTVLQQRVNQLLRTEDKSTSCTNTQTLWQLLATSVLAAMIWLPCDPSATQRSVLSPWPTVSAMAMKELGFAVRDYEIDSHLIREQKQLARLKDVGDSPQNQSKPDLSPTR